VCGCGVCVLCVRVRVAAAAAAAVSVLCFCALYGRRSGVPVRLVGGVDEAEARVVREGRRVCPYLYIIHIRIFTLK
jgi:hypothetical protein